MRECGMLRPAPFGFSRIFFLSHMLTAGGPAFPVTVSGLIP